MTRSLRLSPRHFAADQSGAVTVDYVFVSAAVLAAGLAIAAIVSGAFDAPANAGVAEVPDAAFRAQNSGRDRATVLADGPRAAMSQSEMRQRFNIFSDPAQTSDSQLRDAHRTWSRRVADPAYSAPGMARDWVLLLDEALDLREVRPHADI